jgi:ankyrin repeat protein
MTVRGGALLHVAAEYGFVDACRMLLDRGADVNARAGVDARKLLAQFDRRVVQSHRLFRPP